MKGILPGEKKKRGGGNWGNKPPQRKTPFLFGGGEIRGGGQEGVPTLQPKGGNQGEEVGREKK